MTKSYIIAHINTKNDKLMDEYRKKVPKIVSKYKVKYLIRGVENIMVEGAYLKNWIVVIEFPDEHLAYQFYTSDEYAPLIKIRTKAGINDVVIVKGT